MVRGDRLLGRTHVITPIASVIGSSLDEEDAIGPMDATVLTCNL